MSSYREITVRNYSYIDLGCLAESSHGVDVVVEDDDPHHHPHAEHQRFFTCKPTPVLPGREDKWQRYYLRDRARSSLAPQMATLASSYPPWRTIPDLQNQVNKLLKKPAMVILLESIWPLWKQGKLEGSKFSSALSEPAHHVHKSLAHQSWIFYSRSLWLS